MHEWSRTVYGSPEPLFTLNISMTPFSFTLSFPHWGVVSSQTLLGAQGRGGGVGWAVLAILSLAVWACADV